MAATARLVVTPELLLPLSYAVSRPLMAGIADPVSTAGPVLSAAFVLAVIFRHLDRMLRSLLVPPVMRSPDSLLRAVSFLLQLLASTCWWLAAQVAAELGNAYVLSLCMPRRTRQSLAWWASA